MIFSHDKVTVKETVEISFLGKTTKQFIKANDGKSLFLVCLSCNGNKTLII